MREQLRLYSVAQVYMRMCYKCSCCIISFLCVFGFDYYCSEKSSVFITYYPILQLSGGVVWRSVEDMEAAKLVALKMIILDQVRVKFRCDLSNHP